MLNRLKKSDSGFTIIEVMIVLAIAGLILLIVLLAVPALQRNSRNTTIKNDATALAAGFSEFLSNNDGAAPTSIDVSALPKVQVGAAAQSQAEVKVSASTAVIPGKLTPSTFTPGTLWWNTGKTCGGTTNPRAITVYYYVEVSGTPSTTPKCVDAA